MEGTEAIFVINPFSDDANMSNLCLMVGNFSDLWPLPTGLIMRTDFVSYNWESQNQHINPVYRRW